MKNKLLTVKKLKIKKGDTVQILTGKDNGKSGKVEKIKGKEEEIFVTGLNLFKKHVKGREGIEGGIIEIIKPVKLSNVALVCPNCNKPTRVGFTVEKGEKVRVCRKCKKVITDSKKEK